MSSPPILDPLHDALFRMEQEQHDAGWAVAKREPPSLYWIYGPSAAPYRWHNFPIPDRLWLQYESAHEVVHFVSRRLDLSLTLTQRFVTTDPVIAVVFIYEFWLVVATDEEVDAVRKMADKRQLDQHPERVNTRLLICAGLDGEEVYVARREGEDHSAILEVDDGMLGELPVEMRHLAAVMKRHTRP